MSNAFLTVRVAGEEAAEVLELAIERAHDWSWFWERVADPFVRRSRRMYESQGFGAWAWYEGEPNYEGYKSGIFGRDILPSDLLRWDDQGGGDVRTWTVNEQLAPSLLDPKDINFYHEWSKLTCEIGSAVEHAADIERDTYGPVESGEEPSPARQLTAVDQVFLDDLSDLLGDFAAHVFGGDTRVGITEEELLDRLLGVA